MNRRPGPGPVPIPESEVESDEPLRSRSDDRRERKARETALVELARGLVDASNRELDRLGLEGALLAAVVQTRKIPSPAARMRALRVVRQELRDMDADALALRLRELHEPAKGQTPLESWRDRLLKAPDESLDTLLVEYPEADRQQLRALIRNTVKASETERPRAFTSLTKAIRALLQAKRS